METRRYIRLPVSKLLEDGPVSKSVHDIDAETVAAFHPEAVEAVVAVTMCDCDEDDCTKRGLYQVLGVTDGTIVAASDPLEADAASRLFFHVALSWGELDLFDSRGMDGLPCVVAERPGSE